MLESNSEEELRRGIDHIGETFHREKQKLSASEHQLDLLPMGERHVPLSTASPDTTLHTEA